MKLLFNLNKYLFYIVFLIVIVDYSHAGSCDVENKGRKLIPIQLLFGESKVLMQEKGLLLLSCGKKSYFKTHPLIGSKFKFENSNLKNDDCLIISKADIDYSIKVDLYKCTLKREYEDFEEEISRDDAKSSCFLKLSGNTIRPKKLNYGTSYIFTQFDQKGKVVNQVVSCGSTFKAMENGDSVSLQKGECLYYLAAFDTIDLYECSSPVLKGEDRDKRIQNY